MVNIKLMKCGGLHNALKIAEYAEQAGAQCMLGCMLEAKISVNAAVHLACGKQCITKIDLDGPALCSHDPVIGGSLFNGPSIQVSNVPGLGISSIDDLELLGG
jgi:L-alanine-DL-glutamate epimerase-like enolase superfamily enzyme